MRRAIFSFSAVDDQMCSKRRWGHQSNWFKNFVCLRLYILTRLASNVICSYPIWKVLGQGYDGKVSVGAKYYPGQQNILCTFCVFAKHDILKTGVHLYWYTQHQFLSTSRAGHFVSKSQPRRIMFRTLVNSVGSNIVGAPSELVVPEHLDPTGPMVVPGSWFILCQISNNWEICVTQQLLCRQWVVICIVQHFTRLWTPGILFLNILISQGGQCETFLSWTPLDAKMFFFITSFCIRSSTCWHIDSGVETNSIPWTIIVLMG